MKQDFDDRDAPPDVPAPSVDGQMKALASLSGIERSGQSQLWRDPRDVPATNEFERRQRGEVRQTGPWAPDVPKMSLRDAVASGGTYTPPAFISVGGGMVARRDAIVAAYEAIGLPGTVVLFASGQSIAGSRDYAEFIKELLVTP